MAEIENNIKTKDKDATKWFFIDWALWLGEDTVSNSEWIVPTGITNADESEDGTKHYIKLSGGSDGAAYRVINRITTTDSQETEDATLVIKIQES